MSKVKKVKLNPVCFRRSDLLAKNNLKTQAVDVLRENMVFYNDKATKLGAEIREIIKQEGGKADLLVKVYKIMHECNQIAIDCAAKLAPYQSPKLESVEINKKVEHRYVIRAPDEIADTSDWLKVVNNDKQVQENQKFLEKLHKKADIIEATPQ